MKTKDKSYIYVGKESGEINIQGTTPDLLTLYVFITESMYELKGVEDEDVKLAFDLAKMTPEESQKVLKEKLMKLLEESDKE